MIPGLGRSPAEGKSYPLQYSGLENSMDCIVCGVTKSWTQLSDFHFSGRSDGEHPQIDTTFYNRLTGNFSNKKVGNLGFRRLKYITSSKKQTWNLFSHVLNLISNLINLITSASVIQIVQVTWRHWLDECDLMSYNWCWKNVRVLGGTKLINIFCIIISEFKVSKDST